MNSGEFFPSLVEVISRPSPEEVAKCIDCARKYMIKVIQNEKIEGRKRKFGPGILQALHQEALGYYPGWAGKFRVNDDIRFGGRKPVPAKDLADYVYKFETWLEEEVSNLQKLENYEDLYAALRLAAAAHYAVVGELHPFEDGNGRVARILMNGILMLNANEGRFYNYYIFPVPLTRNQVKEEEIQKMLAQGKEPKVSPYLKALRTVDNTWTLNPFEVYIAGKWIDSIDEFLNRLEKRYKKTQNDKNWKRYLNNEERKLVDKFSERRLRLFAFIEANRKGEYPLDKVPDFYAFKHLAINKTSPM